SRRRGRSVAAPWRSRRGGRGTAGGSAPADRGVGSRGIYAARRTASARPHRHDREDHLLERGAAVLERVLVLVQVAVVVRRVDEVVVLLREDVVLVQASAREAVGFRLLDEDGVALVALQVAAVLVPEARRGLAVADDLGGVEAADDAVVGRQHDGDVLAGELLEGAVEP